MNGEKEFYLKFQAEEAKLIKKYNILKTHAGCYLCNFSDSEMGVCKEFKCYRYKECKYIYKTENNIKAKFNINFCIKFIKKLFRRFI